AAVDVREHQALGGLAAGLLGRLGQALLAQVVDRLLCVGVALLQRLLAVRHARAGALAQVLDHRGGDFSHDRAPLYLSSSGVADASGSKWLPPIAISTRGPSPPD